MTAITDSRARVLTIGALSRATGVNIETIRYYERIGLLPAPPRSANGRRCYAPEHAERLRFVRRARALGFGLDNIRALLGLATQDSGSCAQARALAAAHLAEVRAKRDYLARLETILTDTVAQCDAQCCGAAAPVPACPVLEVLAS
jgi:MerR family transcriptional regulator, mercuric resistance operon regulatory protein